jgi:uncharacterized C2H2 Zn-finger protein
METEEGMMDHLFEGLEYLNLPGWDEMEKPSYQYLDGTNACNTKQVPLKILALPGDEPLDLFNAGQFSLTWPSENSCIKISDSPGINPLLLTGSTTRHLSPQPPFISQCSQDMQYEEEEVKTTAEVKEEEQTRIKEEEGYQMVSHDKEKTFNTSQTIKEEQKEQDEKEEEEEEEEEEQKDLQKKRSSSHHQHICQHTHQCTYQRPNQNIHQHSHHTHQHPNEQENFNGVRYPKNFPPKKMIAKPFEKWTFDDLTEARKSTSSGANMEVHCFDPTCKQSYCNVTDIFDHMNVMHIQHPIVYCEGCTKGFFSNKQFMRHFKKSHECEKWKPKKKPGRSLKKGKKQTSGIRFPKGFPNGIIAQLPEQLDDWSMEHFELAKDYIGVKAKKIRCFEPVQEC